MGTLRDVFPASPSPAELHVFPPLLENSSRRTWVKIFLAIVLPWTLVVTVWLMYMKATGEATGDSSLVGPALICAMGLVEFSCMAVVVMRLASGNVFRGDARIAWQQYAAERGLALADGVALNLPFIVPNNRIRMYTPVASGTVAGMPAWVGGTRSPRTRDDIAFSAYFVLVALPEEVASAFPETSLTPMVQHMRIGSITRLDTATCWWNKPEGRGAQLRLGSNELDSDSRIVVSPNADDPRWRQLFDPTFIDALAREVDVQWE